MKFRIILVFIVLMIIVSGCSSSSKENMPSSKEDGLNTGEDQMEYAEEYLKVIIGDKTFQAQVYDSDTVSELKNLLPLTLDFTELNGNEYYSNLDQDLKVNSEKIGFIEAGDIMLYNSNCIVIFYDSFSTAYSYTPLGKIVDPVGLKEALDMNNRVTIEEVK